MVSAGAVISVAMTVTRVSDLHCPPPLPQTYNDKNDNHKLRFPSGPLINVYNVPINGVKRWCRVRMIFILSFPDNHKWNLLPTKNCAK